MISPVAARGRWPPNQILVPSCYGSFRGIWREISRKQPVLLVSSAAGATGQDVTKGKLCEAAGRGTKATANREPVAVAGRRPGLETVQGAFDGILAVWRPTGRGDVERGDSSLDGDVRGHITKSLVPTVQGTEGVRGSPGVGRRSVQPKPPGPMPCRRGRGGEPGHGEDDDVSA